MILKRSVRCISDVKITAKYSKTAKVCMACFSSFVPFALFAVHGIQVVSAIDSNRERRENRESMYGLFLPVRAARVVRGSWNSKGVSAGILTANCAKNANKKGSASGSLSSTLRKVCRKGSALNPGQQECFLSLPSYHRWLRKTCESLYWFAFPCSRRSRCSRFKILNRSVH